ncbi:PQQ-dependent sugar dehydrogenase [Luteolibacter marinus]|uniref:PQQ-dependent sugar dehydrogenase n=1 Tax=Luteolibacter marinus TaxID=2776705 RepID=UPI001866117D|nr:PQQ-dependent sugar dehydrogenase [Luteolibacter marinus]
MTAPAGTIPLRPLFLALGLAAGALARHAAAATGALSDPLPDPSSSGLSVELSPWITIPASSSGSPKARINHLKPCPGDSRLFCNDLRGKMWAISDNAASSATLYLNLADHFPKFIHTPGLGTGFSSFAFHPEFNQAGKPGFGKLYTAHSETVNGREPDFTGPLNPNLSQLGIVTEWTLFAPGASAISPTNATRRELIRFGFPYNYHDLQEIAFDPTASPGTENYGCLFLCLGDGGSVVIDLPENIGRIDSPLGSILRIAPILADGQQAADFSLSANGNYYIPSATWNANPYFGAADPTPGDGFPVVREIYANGFRNPHRITWDDGKMLCGNIGESMVEEVELVSKGSNHGWPSREGSFLFTAADKTHVYPLPAPESGGYAYPVSQYDHDDGRAALIGGHVYRGASIPYLQGQYLFGDNVSGDLFVAPVAAMNRPAVTDTGETPVAARTLAIKYNGVATTFRTILGASRADLRFGIDHHGELYLLSKQNGTIYRIQADASSAPPPPAGTAADWTVGADFESGSVADLSTSTPGSSAQIVNDPAEGPVNRVLRIRSAGSTTLNASLPIPPIPDGSRATVFFRFFLRDQNHDAHWGLSEKAEPSTSSHFRVRLRSSGQSGYLEVRDSSTYLQAAPVRPDVWYSAWLDVNNAAGTSGDKFDLYLQGGELGVPTLVKSGVRFSSGTTSALQTFFWHMGPGTEMYFDDLHTDTSHLNLTDPRTADWRLVDAFEGENPLESWDLPGVGDQAVSIVTEPSGNHYLRRAAGASGVPNPQAIAAKRLPFDTQVSRTLTLFFRLRLEGGNLHHSLGASATAPADPANFTEDDFAPQLLIDASPTPGTLHLYDGPAGVEGFTDATIPALESNLWHKVWIVANNRGAASGGQVWQAYVQDDSHHSPVALGPPVHFRRQAESPITHFLSIASSSSGADNQAIHLDDLHAFEGQSLIDPLAPVWQPTTLARSGNSIVLGHPTSVNRAFQLFESADLKGWLPLGPSVEGDAKWRELTVPIAHERRFFQAAELSRRSYHASSWTTDFPGPDLPAGITLLASSAWSFEPGRLTLTATGLQVSGMVERPSGYALLPGDWRNATLTVEARTLRPASTTQRDIVLIFGYVDETHFYYVPLSSSSDGITRNAIIKVDGDTATPIQSPAVPPPVLGSDWQTLRVVHNANGSISVHVDNLATPVMTATDTAFPAGRLGIGSCDDPAEFRRVTISGDKP